MNAILCKEVLAPSEAAPANSYVEMPCSSMVRDTLSGSFDCSLPRYARSSLLRMTGIESV